MDAGLIALFDKADATRRDATRRDSESGSSGEKMMNEMKAAIARTQRAELTLYFNCASGGCGIKKSTIVCCEDGDERGGDESNRNRSLLSVWTL